MNVARLGLSRTLLFVAMSGAATCALAETKTWSVFPNNSYWHDGNNWEPYLPPNAGDDLVFSLSYFFQPMVNDLDDGISIRSITFDSNGYRLVGNAITLANASCTRSGSPRSSNDIEVAIVAIGSLQLDAATGCSLVLSGEISGDGSLLVGGHGQVILSGGHSYTGPTATAAPGGFLVVNGTLSATSGVDIKASSGTSTLRGRGAFTAPLNVEALAPNAFVVVAPGDTSGAGILSTGPVTFGMNASFGVRLAGTTAGSEHDQLNVTGGVDLGNTTALDVAYLGYVPPVGTTFTIIRNLAGTVVAGAFEGLPESATFLKNTTTFQISYVGGAGNDVVLTVVPTVAAPVIPEDLAVDPDGNGVLEPGELATLQPTWANASGDSLHLTGTTANFTGPAGALYENPDASGDYGTVAGGSHAPCADCYSVQITAASRPGPHWDASIDELVNPGFIPRTWDLHVGESFEDVPTSQQFYAFIENLFHNGVTGGCGSGAYCPDVSATRAQMAVFLLKAKHGSSYAPPGCAATVFTDVPCPGGEFVDWINRLAAESITAGCGGGKYCPNDPISRGQMAVFLLKGEHGGSYVPPACAETVFDDVPCPNAQFVDWINRLAFEGVTAGCGGGNFCPVDPIDRGQMAVFLVQAFDLLLYRP